MAETASNFYVSILAGGEGTRLWPLSRGRRPKQVLPLASDRSLIQQTVDRVLPLIPAERILVVTERSHADDLRAQLPELPARNILVETSRRNTAAAVLLAALHIEAWSPDATWASLHSDAFILDDEEFRATLAAALEAAARGTHLLTTGLRPQHPSTAFGYIHQAEQIGDAGGYPVFRVERFVEKPDLATARQYIRSGQYLWNPGVFAWKNTSLLAAYRQHQADLYRVLSSVPVDRIAEVYDQAPRQTIDNGILEPSTNVATIPATFRWADIGSWSELWDALDKDSEGNVTRGFGRHLSVDTHGTLVFADGRAVATIGVQDLVVVATADAVLVCPRNRAHDVRSIVRQLQEEGVTALL